MNFIKKQAAGSWLTFIALIVAAVSLIVYRVNIGSEGYFKNASVPYSVNYCIAGIVALAVVLIMGQINVSGIAKWVGDICLGILRIAAPAVFIGSLMVLISSRIEGFAFIYMSNEEVLHEVQTAENLASAHGTIANMILLAVAAVIGMVAAFFSLKKKDKAN